MKSLRKARRNALKRIARIGLVNYLYDWRRFSTYFNSSENLSRMQKEQAKSHLLRTMHSLEKGMALPDPRPGFGKEKALKLYSDAVEYKKRFGSGTVYFFSMSVLKTYFEFQRDRGVTIAELDMDELQIDDLQVEVGVKRQDRADVWKKSRLDFRGFVESRSSVRIFTGDVIPEERLIEAIDIARKSPSVCNRACARAYYTNDRKLMDRMLSAQQGNSGFGHLAGGLVVVTADNRAFYKTGERNQGWVDGGLFAMTLNYAFHSMGYGVCMLNWSKSMYDDARFRRSFGIPEELSIVMLMAVGHLPDTFVVAASPRRPVSTFAIPLVPPEGRPS